MSTIRPALSDAYRLIRAYFAALAPCGRSFHFRSPDQWRELAQTARALADECERAARLIENLEQQS